MASGKLKSGKIQFAGAHTPGWISNLGMTLSAGTFTITDVSGNALTQANPGWVTVPSTTAGQFSMLKVESGGTFIDDAGSSNIIGELFGVTTSIAWAQDVPFFIYVVNRADSDIDGADGSSAFFITRDPRMSTTPSDANKIGDTGAVSVDKDQDSIFILDDVTTANYTSLPCQIIGAIRMRMSSSDDWTVQTLGNADGIGEHALISTFSTVWTFPAGQRGAVANYHTSQSSGTPPTWATPGNITYQYVIDSHGFVLIKYTTRNAGAVTASATAVQLRVHLPYNLSSTMFSSTTDNYIGGFYSVTGQVENDGHITLTVDLDTPERVALNSGGLANIAGDDFTDSADDIELHWVYKAY
jgi:hypothetical protein